jgi:hypothetical protein
LGLVDQVLARISHDRGALIGVQVRKGPV